MDALDIRILRHMGFLAFLASPHHPELFKPNRIAAAVGVTAETARERIARMEREGIIGGYEIYPNFHQLGLTPTTQHFRVRDTSRKTQRIEAVADVDGVVGVYDFVGPQLCVDIAHRGPPDLARKVAIVERVLEAAPAHYPCFVHDVPPAVRPLDAVDWRIIRALRGNAMRSLDEVGVELVTSGRTVRRRFGRMAAEGALDVVPIVNPGQMTGFILFELIVTFDGAADAATARSVLDAIGDALAAAWSVPEGHADMLTAFTLARSVAAMEAVRVEVERAPHVTRAEVLLPTGNNFARPGWIDDAIDAEIQRLSRPAARLRGS